MLQAEELLADDVILRVDGRLIAHGQRAWFRWVTCLHNTADKNNMADARIVVDDIKDNNGVVSVEAHWQTARDGDAGISAPGKVEYVVRGGKITEIRTHRRNYVVFYGARIANSWAAFYWLLLRVSFRRLSAGEGQGRD